MTKKSKKLIAKSFTPSLSAGQLSIVKCQLLRKRGFSLIEVLVTLMILSIGITAISALMTGNIRASVNAKNQIIASGLAQEGIELVRNLKDKTPEFTTVTDLPNGTDYRIDYNSDYSAFKASNIVSNPQKKLNLDNNGKYLHAGTISTKFYRKIKISTDVNGNRQAESLVSWNGASVPAGTVADPCNVAKKCVSVVSVLPDAE